jgi:hypothetical protein
MSPPAGLQQLKNGRTIVVGSPARVVASPSCGLGDYRHAVDVVAGVVPASVIWNGYGLISRSPPA